MVTVDLREADANLEALHADPYPGRGNGAGISESGKEAVLVGWMMGRRWITQNRLYINPRHGLIKTELAEPMEEVDPLTLYNAMAEANGLYIASNGDHTDTIAEYSDKPRGLISALCTREYEPDPLHTPRIAAAYALEKENPALQLAILRKEEESDECIRSFYHFSGEHLEPGIGFFCTTYTTKEGETVSFQGPPYALPLLGPGPTEVAQHLWDSLNPEFRVGLVVKFIDIATGASRFHIINQYEGGKG